MTNRIVTVNVTETVAPTPSTLQKTGAFISQGATTLDAGTTSILTQLSDLTAILDGSHAITSITQTTGLATATTTAPHGIPNGEIVNLTIAGASPVAYNGIHACTSTGASTVTFAIASGTASPATGTIIYTESDVAELLAMATTFFSQGAGQAVYVLELGLGDPAAGVTALTAFITANPDTFYSYLVPREWSSEASFLTFLAGFENPTSKTYFFVTATTGNYNTFTALMKCAFVLIEAPLTPTTEFSLASVFYVTLNYDPSTTNKLTPTAFAYLFGVTPYPTSGNSALFATLKAAGVNIIGTGAEGGISNTILLWGTTMDVKDFSYWYSVDWVQINIDLDVSNAVINGSNDPINPLYYNQDGINRLQAVAANTMSRGVTFGLVLGSVTQTDLDGPQLTAQLNAGNFTNQTVINAVPFVPYSRSNPGDYKIGKYSGFAIIYTPTRGFIQIIFNVNVTDFVAA